MNYKVTKNISLLIFALLTSLSGMAQQAFDFAKAEKELTHLYDTLARGENQHIRYNANEQFLTLLQSTLEQNGAFDYPFEQLMCKKLMPKDKKFRLFNWFVRKEEGMEFFAVMLVHNEQKKTYQVLTLTDDSENIFDLPNVVLDKDHWYGAYYLEVIQTEGNGRTYYTFLGWNGNDKTIQQNLIEVLTFKPNGDLVFGANVFAWRKEKFKRKVFEHSRKGTMILRYDYQVYTEPIPGAPKPKPGQKPKEKTIKAYMIVFDRLVPPNPEMLGNLETYIPAGGIYDALVWENNKWTLKTDVLARNPEPSFFEKIRQKFTSQKR